jgi:hypothetical protein
VRKVKFGCQRIEHKRIHTTDLALSLADAPDGVLGTLLEESNVAIKSMVPIMTRLRSQALVEPAEEEGEGVLEAGLPPISRNVRRILDLARNKADELSSKTIEENHLVFGFLSGGGRSVKILADLSARRGSGERTRICASRLTLLRHGVLITMDSTNLVFCKSLITGQITHKFKQIKPLL